MKKTVSLVLALLIVFLCGVTVYAEDDTLGFVTDAAGLLTDPQISKLFECGQILADQYGCGVYLVTVDSYTEFDAGSIDQVSESIYQYYDMGIGSEKNGIMLILSMNEREYDLCAFGNAANTAFTDYGRSLIEDEILDNFRDDDWYGGFEDYYLECEYLLMQYANGEPVDIWITDEPGYVNPNCFYIFGKAIPQQEFYIFGVGLPLIVALVACLIMRSKMKNVSRQYSAENYMTSSRAQMTYRSDDFQYITTQRVKIEENRSSGGSGGHFGGTSVNSSGFSHSSGKF